MTSKFSVFIVYPRTYRTYRIVPKICPRNLEKERVFKMKSTFNEFRRELVVDSSKLSTGEKRETHGNLRSDWDPEGRVHRIRVEFILKYKMNKTEIFSKRRVSSNITSQVISGSSVSRGCFLSPRSSLLSKHV